MAMPGSGTISLWDVNNQIGNGTGEMSLFWVSSNTVYNFKDLNSLHGLAWFTAYSSNGGISRGTTWTTTNCATNCASQTNPKGFPQSYANNYNCPSPNTNCTLIANVNCNQCGTSHGTYLQGNCNCACNCYVCNCAYNNCNCNCNCDCMCQCCFAAGSLVMLVDRTWKPVEELVEGDFLMGATGVPARVTKLHVTTLGQRRLLQIGSLKVSEEHGFWSRINGEEGLWSYNPDLWRAEVANGHFPGLKDNAAMRACQRKDDLLLAHISGWRWESPQILDAASDTPLYLPMTAGVPIIVEGFVVDAGADELAFERDYGVGYSGMTWRTGRLVRK